MPKLYCLSVRGCENNCAGCFTLNRFQFIRTQYESHHGEFNRTSVSPAKPHTSLTSLNRFRFNLKDK